MSNVTSATSQQFLVYTPPVARTDSAETPASLTPARWQQQMGHLVNLFEGAPGVAPTGGAGATEAAVQTGAVAPSQATAPTDQLSPVAGRHGKVLSADKFLKADQYSGIHHESLQTSEHQVRIPGAPNYREIGDNIHGVAQPTVEGIKGVLDKAGCAPGSTGKPAVWTNLRQEPVVYVNGAPFNLRDLKHPMDNEAAPGRTAEQVDQREQELKQEVLAEAKRNGGNITLHDEVGKFPNNHIVERQVKADSVETVKEVYDGLEKEGYNVKYQRIPVTDTKKPEDRDLDALTKSLKDVDPDSPLIFNCHAGEGRTTTGMVAASLLRRAEKGDHRSVLRDPSVHQDIKEQGNHDPRNYRAIVKSVQDSEQLMNTQHDADSVIASYSDVHDLKGSVGSERKKSEDASKTPAQRAEAKQHATDYLERYHTIVSYDQYVQEEGPGFKTSYSDWKKHFPEIQQNLDKATAALASPAG
jgi:protein-tyrosine phosphatase